MNDIVNVPIEIAEQVLKHQSDDWCVGYAFTVNSSQGVTLQDPQKVWIIDDFLQWLNLTYLAVSRVEYMRQLERVTCPSVEVTEVRQLTKQQLRKAIQKKLVAYNRQD